MRKFTPCQQKQGVNFSIATNDNYRNKQGERIEQTTYSECAIGFLQKSPK